MNINLSKIKNVHFIGIGGIGISAIARMMFLDGKNVNGQDMQKGEVVCELIKLGIEIKVGQSYENIPVNTDLIVYTIAIDTFDLELSKKIRNQKLIPVKSYPEMLDIISKDKYTIAVAGTHGKTTTTAMISQILLEANYDPTVIVGSLLVGSKSNFIGGKSKYFVVEACEYRRSFLNLSPAILVITNIDEDHLDYYKDIEDIKNAFRTLALKVPQNGYVVCNINDKNIREVVSNIEAKIIDWEEYYKKDLELKVPGIYNKKNAAAALAVSSILKIEESKAQKYVCNFKGTWRRFEFKGLVNDNIMVYDDYAHHPVEVTASLQGFRELFPKQEGWNITVIFQPHLFSRTKLLLNDFAKSFYEADSVLILPIYYAREVDDGTISSLILSNEINKYSNNSVPFNSFEELSIYIKNKSINMDNKNLIVTMGAGDAFLIGDLLLNK